MDISISGLDFLVAQGQGQWTNLRLDENFRAQDYDRSNERSPTGHGNSVSNNKDSNEKRLAFFSK